MWPRGAKCLGGQISWDTGTILWKFNQTVWNIVRSLSEKPPFWNWTEYVTGARCTLSLRWPNANSISRLRKKTEKEGFKTLGLQASVIMISTAPPLREEWPSKSLFIVNAFWTNRINAIYCIKERPNCQRYSKTKAINQAIDVCEPLTQCHWSVMRTQISSSRPVFRRRHFEDICKVLHLA
jgi:hypothetical protein